MRSDLWLASSLPIAHVALGTYTHGIGPKKLAPTSEQALSNWIRRHLSFAVYPADDRDGLKGGYSARISKQFQQGTHIALAIGIFALSIGAARAMDKPPGLKGEGDRLQRTLVTAWQALNEDCRGGSGDEPATVKACERRTVVSEELRAHGCRYHQGDYWTCSSTRTPR
jgi:hypothetical protein